MDTLLLVAMIVEGLMGIGCVLDPVAALGPLGATFNDSATSFARLFGSALIGLTVMLWFARRSDKPEFKKGAVYTILSYYLVSAVLLFMMKMSGLMNSLGWIAIGSHVALSAWCGSFIVRRSGSDGSAEEDRSMPK